MVKFLTRVFFCMDTGQHELLLRIPNPPNLAGASWQQLVCSGFAHLIEFILLPYPDNASPAAGVLHDGVVDKQ